ncbi:MAG: hypothetical protein K0Q50_2762 [Vampirovibrio sp.]|nr:hypothetical protein [Vampirovibrio sp.]
MSMGQVGGNNPYGNQGDYRYQNYQYPSGNYPQYAYGNSAYSRYGKPGQGNSDSPRGGYAPKPAAGNYSVSTYYGISPTATQAPSIGASSGSGVSQTSNNDSSTEKPKVASDSPGKELMTESQSLQSEVQADAKAKKAEGGGGDGGGSGDAMKAISVLMTVAGVVTSMDLIAKALQVTGLILKTVGQGIEMAGTAMDAAGMAMMASGQALCSNPFTLAVGLAMISAGTALKVAGNAMKIAGKVLKVTGNVLEKTARAMQKALKVLMRGAKNTARRGMQKFRKMKMARAKKAARKAKMRAKKHPKGSAKHTKYQGQQAAQQAKIKNLAQSMKKTDATIARKQAKNAAAINGLKTGAQNGLTKVKAAPGQAASRMSNGAKKQWASYTQQLKGTFKQPKTSIKGASQNAKAGLKTGWQQGATKANGANRFSSRWGKMKTNVKNMKPQFRKTDTQVAKAAKAKQAKAAQAAKTAKVKQAKAARAADIKKLKLDPKITAKLKSFKTGKSKPPASNAQSAKYAKDDMAVAKASKAKTATSAKDDLALAGSKSSKPATTKADRAAEIEKLKLDPKVAAKADNMAKGGATASKTGTTATGKAGANSTKAGSTATEKAGATAAETATKKPMAWGKMARWGGGVAMMGFGGAMIADSFNSGGGGGNDYLAIKGSKTWDEFHNKYDTPMTNANAGYGPYRSGYYDPTYLGDPSAYPGTPKQVPGYNYAGANSYNYNGQYNPYSIWNYNNQNRQQYPQNNYPGQPYFGQQQYYG